MGAKLFGVTEQNDTVDGAFTAAVERALRDHGYDGYTGTIAEKSDYVLFDLPEGVTSNDVLDALNDYRVGKDGFIVNEPSDSLISLLGSSLATRLYKVYDDKWGPAVAIKVDDSTWLFCGWASC